jgi:hypothetical protein
MNAAQTERRFSLERAGRKNFSNFFRRIGANIAWAADRQNLCNSLLSDAAAESALDVEAGHGLSMRRAPRKIESIALSIDSRDEQVESRADVVAEAFALLSESV